MFLIKAFAVSLFLMLVTPFVFAEENITITTYYPSPNGVYKSLKAKRMAVGDTYFQKNWVDQGGTIPNDVNLTVEGKWVSVPPARLLCWKWGIIPE